MSAAILVGQDHYRLADGTVVDTAVRELQHRIGTWVTIRLACGDEAQALYIGRW